MSTTVGARLKVLSRMTNATVGAMLLAIGTGATVGAILVNYSRLPTGTVSQHLLVEHDISLPIVSLPIVLQNGRKFYAQRIGRITMYIPDIF